jgi:hypothetical protein
MYFIDAHCRVDGGYAPRIIIEGDAERYSIGNHENPHPYVWGPTLDDAKREAQFRNVSEFHLEPEEQAAIVSSVFAAQDAKEYPSVFVRDGEGAVRMSGYTVRIPVRPAHGCALPPVESQPVYFLISHADGEDFLTTDWDTFVRRYKELTSSGVTIYATEYLIGSPINMTDHPGV